MDSLTGALGPLRLEHLFTKCGPDQHHWHHGGLVRNAKRALPNPPDLMGWGPAICIITSPPGYSNDH